MASLSWLLWNQIMLFEELSRGDSCRKRCRGRSESVKRGISGAGGGASGGFSGAGGGSKLERRGFTGARVGSF